MQPPLLGPTLLTSKQQSTLIAEKEPPQAEEKSDSEEEEKGPSEDYTCFGVNLKPFLPVTLALSTVIGGACFFVLQLPMLCRLTSISSSFLFSGCAFVYTVTLACMVYAAFADPGQLNEEKNTRSVEMADIEQGRPAMPVRAHQSWQYERPIRRYDHFCKWLNNAIGLLNHREFVVTVGGLMSIAMLGIVVDTVLEVLVIAHSGLVVEDAQTQILLVLHFAYSLTLLKIVWPILRIHFGLISRNEMGQEWKNHWHYVANNTTKGDHVYVHELDDEEYNELLDGGAFVYDASRNPFDRGCLVNCWTFWCQARWTADAKGEF